MTTEQKLNGIQTVHAWLATQSIGFQTTSEEAAQATGVTIGAAGSALLILEREKMLRTVGRRGRKFVYEVVEIVDREFRSPMKPRNVSSGFTRPNMHRRSVPQLDGPGLIESIGAVVAAAQEASGAVDPERPKSLSERLLELAIEVEAMERRTAAMEADRGSD